MIWCAKLLGHQTTLSLVTMAMYAVEIPSRSWLLVAEAPWTGSAWLPPDVWT